MKKQKEEKLNSELQLDFNIERNPTFYNGTVNLENNFLKKMNINKIIDGKKREIKLLVKKKLGKTEFSINKRKPSPLKFLEKGLEKLFFSRNSDLLVHFPKIRKKLWYEQQRISNDLNEKIDIGSLVYFQLKDSKLNNLNEKYLKRSSIFKIENSADTVENEIQKIMNQRRRQSQMLKYRKSITENNQSPNSNINIILNPSSNQNLNLNPNSNSNLNNINQNSNTINSTINTSRNKINIITINNNNTDNNNKNNNNKNMDDNNNDYSNNKLFKTINNSSSKKSRNKIPNLFKLTSYNTPKNKKIKPYLTTSLSNTQENSDNNNNNRMIETNSTSRTMKTKSTFNFFSSFKSNTKKKSLIKHKKIRSYLIEKVSLLGKSTNKCNNQLYKIVDNSKNKERELSRLKDLEEIFSMKRREKNPSVEKTKNLVYQAKNDIYFGMDKHKADLLTLTDEVTRMPDDVALYLVDRIAKNYENKSNLVEEVTNQLNLNPIIKNIRNIQAKKLREKLKDNYQKILMLDAKLEQKKEEMYLLHDFIFHQEN